MSGEAVSRPPNPLLDVLRTVEMERDDAKNQVKALEQRINELEADRFKLLGRVTYLTTDRAALIGTIKALVRDGDVERGRAFYVDASGQRVARQ